MSLPVVAIRHSGCLFVLVTGGRGFDDKDRLRGALDRLLTSVDERGLRMVLIEGGATGADRIARLWTWDHNVQCITERADWTTHGDAAGPIRNQLMLDRHQPDLCLAAPGGPGTSDMVERCRKAGVPVIFLE